MLQTELLTNSFALLNAILDIAENPKRVNEGVAVSLWANDIAPHLPCTDDDARRMLCRCHTAAKLAKLRFVTKALRKALSD